MVLRPLEFSETILLRLIVLRPVVSFSPFITDFLPTVAKKMRTP